MKMSPQASWRTAALLRRKAARLLPSRAYRYREMALRFDLNGDAVEILPAAYRGETLSVLLGGKPVSAKTIAAIFSGPNVSKGS